MKIAVVGGSGFVGRHVVARLTAAGSTVVTVDVRPPRTRLSTEAVVLASLHDEHALARAAAECGRVDALVWLAARIASPPVTDAAAIDDFTVMAEAPLRFLDALDGVLRSVVYASSIEVYGTPEKLPVGEEHPTNPTGVYGAAKLAAEHYLRIRLRDSDSAFAALRLAFVYGPGQHPHNVIPRFLARLRRGEPPVLSGDGAEVRDDVFVGDVARAMELAISERADGVFNIATADPHTLLHVADVACRVAGSDLAPTIGNKPSAWVDRWYDVSLARDTFGFHASTSIEDGLRAMWCDEPA